MDYINWLTNNKKCCNTPTQEVIDCSGTLVHVCINCESVYEPLMMDTMLPNGCIDYYCDRVKGTNNTGPR